MKTLIYSRDLPSPDEVEEASDLGIRPGAPWPLYIEDVPRWGVVKFRPSLRVIDREGELLFVRYADILGRTLDVLND